ncbi:MAG: hypothetical protein JW953_21995 [Anaerolineae bacterium]|nr:hypothetical protein [Anaerolineae bacterium]
MVNVVTYSLRDGQKNSGQYYQDVAVFTDEVLVEAEDRVGALVKAFQTYLRQTGRETPRSGAEYAFELLTLGVLWQTYANVALVLGRPPPAHSGRGETSPGRRRKLPGLFCMDSGR